MVYQMLNCLHDLRYKAHLLHRNVSFSNIMVQQNGPDGKPLFILNDFDLATCVTDDGKFVDGPTAKHRSGSLPFMAWEKLSDLWALHERTDGNDLLPVGHRLRYDYESLLYVALWCAFKCEKVPALKKKVAEQVAAWELGPYDDLATKKSMLLGQPHSNRAHTFTQFRFTPLFEPWRKWFWSWIKAVSSAVSLVDDYGSEACPTDLYNESDPSVVDYETMNGVWTRDNILKVLRAAEPTPLPQ
ncbi:hypothetical protein PsYK624_092850 [Phanerochaete sordida]|uniref:Protein kinase domain-containing protein n=1 Tax=Phanerochaete sordida TaxID=48140 RepID=A0A9P3GDX1_9APHY|nr:hypothetical protein PsYK624_092850 [Phanerochaete sordida]